MVEATPTQKSFVPDDEQGADFVELFFDLVFVFAITRITHLTVEHLSVSQVLQSVLIFWLIWWGWTQFTWALNAADTRNPEVRLVTLIATAVAFVMATATDQVFGAGVMWFAVSYIIIRLLGLGLFLRVTPSGEDHRSAVVACDRYAGHDCRLHCWSRSGLVSANATFCGTSWPYRNYCAG